MIPTWVQQLSAPGSGALTNWILFTGFWGDARIWIDTAVWID